MRSSAGSAPSAREQPKPMPPKVHHLTAIDLALGQQEKPRRPARRPSVARLIRQARKAGATSIATPEGYVMQFEATDTSQRNEWDEVCRVKN